MKIIFVVHRYHTNLFSVTKALQEAGHELKIIVPENKAYENLIEDYSFLTPIVLNDRDLTINFVYKKLCEWQPDILIIRHFHGKWVLFSILSFFLRIKRVTYNPGPFINNDLLKVVLRPYLTRLIKGRPIKRFTPVKGIHGNFKEKFSTYIPFPIEPIVDISNRVYYPSGVIRILCIGKLGQKRKKHTLLLDALEKINASTTVNCTVTFIGTGPSYGDLDMTYWEYFKQRCENTSLHNKIRIIMDVPYQNIFSYYVNSDIFVFPAERESVGFAVLEALAAGCGVVTSDDVGAAGYIENNVNGLVFENNNLEELASSLKFLMEKPQRIVTLGGNALKKIKKEHNLKIFAEKFTQL